MITRGAGCLGNAVLKRFINTEIREIRIFSRDEKKQDDMRHQIQSSKVKFYIGDATKASTKRGWIPEYDLAYLVKDRMQSDLHLMTKGVYLQEGGYTVENYFE